MLEKIVLIFQKSKNKKFQYNIIMIQCDWQYNIDGHTIFNIITVYFYDTFWGIMINILNWYL